MATDSNINIRITSSADTAGIDAANKALDEMGDKQQGAADSARIDEIVSPAAIETVTATTEAFGEMEDQTRDLDARLQQAARSYMATGTSAERAMGTIVLSYDRTASAAKTAQAAVYSLQQALSEVSSTGTIGLGISPETAKTVDETTTAYEELLQRVAELEQQLQQQAKTHKATRAAAEQSAGGIVGAYKRAKAAVMTVKGAINSVMWWMAAANQAVELVGKVWDVVNSKARAAKEAAKQEAEEEEKRIRRLKDLEQLVRAEITARKQAAREMEQAKVNRIYEDRIKYIERAMELEAIAAAARARAANNDYEVKQAELMRDLATQKITQAEYDERSRQEELDHNETLRKLEEENAKSALDAAEAKERINKRMYEQQLGRLRKIKEAAGATYHEIDLLGTKVSVGLDPVKPKVMTSTEYNNTLGKEEEYRKMQGDANATIAAKEKRLAEWEEALRGIKAVYGDDVQSPIEEKAIADIKDELKAERERLEKINKSLTSYRSALEEHRNTLLSFGLVDKQSGDAEKWTKGADVFYKEKKELEGSGTDIGRIKQAQDALATSTHNLTTAQTKYKDTLAANEEARKKEAQVTDAQRVGRSAEQSRAAEQQASAARVGAAQVTVDQLQRTAEQQQQAAKAQQEAIDKMIKDTSDKDFKTYLDRMESIITRQSNEGGYRDRLQQAFEMYKGYISSSPDQLAGKMDEMTEVLRRVTLPYSMTGGQDSATFTRMMEALLAKAALGTQMRGTAQQQQTAGNNLTEVRDAETSIATANEHEQTQRAAITAVATAAKALRERITDPQQQADLDTIIEVMGDGRVAADETSVLVNAFGSLADANREAADSLVSGLSTAVKSGEGFLAFAREMLGKTAEGAAASQRQEAEITALRGSIANIKWSNGTLP